MVVDEALPPGDDDGSEQAATLEQALAASEAAADRALRAAAQLTQSLRRFRASAQTGNLRDLRALQASVKQAAELAVGQSVDAAESWTFDEDTYLGSESFTAELLAAADAAGLQLFERDDRIYCYPVLVRVAPAERSVFIDRARERRIRPSVLIEQLRGLQRKPARFRPDAFLESLFQAYGHLVARHGPDQIDAGHTVPLAQVYELLTLQPGAGRDYSRQEFARDVYLLDRGGVTTTRRGYVVSFPASTGARAASGAVRVVTETGQEKVYYGIAFTPAG